MENEIKNGIEMQYAELKKRYKLPDFSKLDYEFELRDMEPTNFLLISIIRRIAERIDFYAGLIEEVLQPDASNLYAMHKMESFDDDEKKSMYDLYIRLKTINSKIAELSLERNEKSEVDFISSFWSEWPPIRSELTKFARKMGASWKAEADARDDLRYMG